MKLKFIVTYFFFVGLFMKNDCFGYLNSVR